MQKNKHELQVVQQGEQLLYDARLLHNELKSKRQFTDWVKAKIIESLFKEGTDYFSQKSEKLGVGRKGIDYLLTTDTAKHIAMMENNEVGYAVRCKFIAKEKELRGISQLPNTAGLFKGLKPRKINDRVLYPYRDILVRSGYSANNNGNRRHRYWMHFVKEGNLLYVTQEFALHLYHQKAVLNNRKVMVASQPVLALEFYNEKEVHHA